MKVKHILKDVRFWIIIFFMVRLVGITNPPLELSHNWRQSTVTMVSRNFIEIDNNIFFPRIDIAEDKTGITGMEFPAFNYTIYVISEIFGYQHWYGRLINLIISSLGLLFFFKLIKKYFGDPIAFYATIILLVSIWFQFSRKIMPDTFAMSLIIASIYYGSNYLDNKLRRNNIFYLCSYFLLLMFGVLSKLPSGFLLIIFGLFYLKKDITIKRKLVFSIVTVIAIIPSIIWYFYWVPYLVSEYGLWHFFMGRNFSQGYNEIIKNFGKVFSRFYDTALKFIGFSVFVIGLIVSILERNWKIFSVFMLCLVSFFLIMLKAGSNFSHHNYYIIPFVPVMALVAGYGLSEIKNSKIAIILIIAIVAESLTSRLGFTEQTTTPLDYTIRERDTGVLTLENDLDKISKRNDLIIINSGAFPTPMYFAHRKGWVDTNEKINNQEYIEELKNKGLKYIVILKRSFGKEIKLPQYKSILENKDYCIYKL